MAELFGELIGRRIAATARPASPAAVALPASSLAATYVDESGDVRLIAVCDLAVGASLGAALVVMPPTCVADCVKAQRLEEGLHENLFEVFNVLAGLFPRHGAPRLILGGLERIADLAVAVPPRMAASTRRVDLDLAVTGYGTGRFALLEL